MRRVFYIFDNVADVVRGCHANRYSEFVMFCIQGGCRVCVDNGKTKSVVALNNPQKVLWLNKMVWKEMFDFSADCVLVVLSNTLYDPAEYLRDYGQFLKTLGV